MATIRYFQDLRCWQRCREVRLRVRQVVRSWPAEEKYRLIDQIIRSSRGPTSHIAEGFGRFHERDNARFCRIARGSLFETQDHLITALDEGFVSNEVHKELMALSSEAINLVSGYIAYLERGVDTSVPKVAEPSALYGMQSASVPPPGPDHPLEADL